MTMIETLASAVPALAILSGAFFLFAVGGFVADYILPRIPAVERFLDTLPGCGRED